MNLCEGLDKNANAIFYTLHSICVTAPNSIF